MNFALIDWRKLLIVVLLFVLKLLGAVDDETVKVGIVAFFGANGLEHIGKGIAAKNGGGNGGAA